MMLIKFFPILDSHHSMQEAYDAGATDFINKPFNNFEVFLRVQNALRYYDLSLQNMAQESLMQKKAEDNESLLVREYMTLYGGKVQLTSTYIDEDEKNHGSSFTLVFQAVSCDEVSHTSREHNMLKIRS